MAGSRCHRRQAERKNQHQRGEQNLQVCKRSPRLTDYFEFYESVKDAKPVSTLHREQHCRHNWLPQLGEIRLKAIARAHVNGLIARR